MANILPHTISPGTDMDANEVQENFEAVSDTIGTLSARVESIAVSDISQILSLKNNLEAKMASMFPVGSIYLSLTDTCPLETTFGHWEKIASGRTIWGSDNDHAAGTTIAAGLPNITGHWASTWGGGVSGAIYSTDYWDTGWGHKGDHHWGNVNYHIDASRSSSVYGNSDTVQPPAFVVNIWKRVS